MPPVVQLAGSSFFGQLYRPFNAVDNSIAFGHCRLQLDEICRWALVEDIVDVIAVYHLCDRDCTVAAGKVEHNLNNVFFGLNSFMV